MIIQGQFSPILIALDKRGYKENVVVVFFLLLQENLCCGYSLEMPQ